MRSCEAGYNPTMFDGKHVVAVVAIGKNREIGNGNKLLWHIPEDLRRFKKLTEGHPIIMGRKTFESIVGYIGKPLPGRTNVVLTRNPDFFRSKYTEEAKNWDNVKLASTFDDALVHAAQSPGADEIHIGGGGEMYELAFPYIDKLHLTIVDSAPEADVFFPQYKHYFKVTSEEKRDSNGIVYSWVDLERV